jgi:hypothetical protein
MCVQTFGWVEIDDIIKIENMTVCTTEYIIMVIKHQSL